MVAIPQDLPIVRLEDVAVAAEEHVVSPAEVVEEGTKPIVAPETATVEERTPPPPPSMPRIEEEEENNG